MNFKTNPPALFCHVHISKTGGTSLNLLLARWFPCAFEVVDHPDPNHVLEIDALGEYLIQRPQLSCVSTHHLRTFPTAVAGRRVHYFTILREPMDRAVSLLTFMRKYSSEFTDEHKRILPAHFEQTAELDILEQWTEETISARRSGKFAGNPVTATFIGKDLHCDFLGNRRACETAAAAKCIAVLNRFLFVGDFANFEASVHELARRIRALGASTCEIDQMPSERISRDRRDDLKWLEEGRAVVDAYMDGLMIDGMVYRHFAHTHRPSTTLLRNAG